MNPTHVINCDLAKVYEQTPKGFNYLVILGWGEPVEVKEITPEHVRVAATSFDKQPEVVGRTSQGT